MEQRMENRGRYQIAVYDVDITEEMRKRALEFAKRIILSGNQYSRLLPSEIKNSGDVTLKQKIELQRTYMGKLGEMVFLTYLRMKGKTVSDAGMFEVYEGEENVDSYDFVTVHNKTVDVKTGFRNNHQRLLINTEQFDNANKDYYVAVKLNAADVEPDHKLVDWEHITKGTVLGYAKYQFLLETAQIHDFGEGPARFLAYGRLLGIDRLLREF